MISCSVCGYSLTGSEGECPNCGAVLEKQPLPPIQHPICPDCGSQNPLEARFCSYCGISLTKQDEEAPEISKPPEDVQPTSDSNNAEPEQLEPSTPSSPPVQQQVASTSTPKIKRAHIFAVVGGIVSLFCLCALAVTGYIIVRPLMAFPNNSDLPETQSPTQPEFILPISTKPSPTKRPTLTPTFTVLPTSTRLPTLTFTPRPSSTPTSSKPSGRIVFSCQMDGVDHDQICIINADGTSWRQLTDNGKHNWYASISPDGQNVVFSSNMTGNNYEIYEISSRGGNPIQLTSHLGGKLYAPEISPDGRTIVFTHDDNNFQSVWVMNRDGSNPHRVSPDDGWDPSWSSDGKLILFASLSSNNSVQLFTMNENGGNVKQITNMSGLIGRSDMSPSGELVATYAGKYGSRSIYVIPVDDPKPIEYSFPPTAAAPSFSPDGQWFTFTGYIDYPDDFDRGCEIYITRLDDPTDIIRLTNNRYCDWQPRWGP
jgi:TolB protein